MGQRLRSMAARIRRLAALALLAGTLAGCGEPFYLGGIQIREPDTGEWIRTLKAEGFNTVSVTVYARQNEWNRPALGFDPDALWLVPEIRAAKEAGVKVVLILRVELDHAFDENRFLWHGLIAPETDEGVKTWFRRYGRFAAKWAKIAEEEGVDVLGIASEMNHLASTVPIDALPGLERYYLDREQQKHYRESVLRYAERIDTEGLWAGWNETFDSVEAYLEEQSAALAAWAEKVTLDGDLERINRRRKLLESQWIELIAELRRIYSGRLTYAANFDQYQSVSFWAHLDLIGINAYFPLRHEPLTPRARPPSPPPVNVSVLYPVLEQAWVDILGQVRDFRQRVGVGDHPVMFTELGYTARLDSTLKPWAGDGFDLVGPWEDPDLMVFRDQPQNVQERALAVRALRHAADKVDEDLLQGLLYWKLSTQEEHRQIEPFVLIVGSGARDPLLGELQGFTE